jgi:hypothetical protein
MRYRIIILLFLGVWALMVGRLYQVSVKSGFYYEKLAKTAKIYIKTEKVLANIKNVQSFLNKNIDDNGI